MRLINLKVKPTKENKERRGRKEEKRKKAMVALLVFIMATLTTKKLLDGRGQFGSNVFKIQLDVKKLIKRLNLNNHTLGSGPRRN